MAESPIPNVWNGAKVVKIGIMEKRSQHRSPIGRINVKERIFILTTNALFYLDGTLQRMGKEKGRVHLSHINVVEYVDDAGLRRCFTFQICHQNLTLYIIAPSETVREDWITSLQKLCRTNACMLPKYHKGIWDYGPKQWSCCGQINKEAVGCEISYTHRAAEKRPLPTPPVKNANRKVIAIYSYRATDSRDLSLVKGEEVTIVDDSKEAWWLAENSRGFGGYVPATYVIAANTTSLEKYDWYFDITREQADAKLMSDGRVGCFLIRKSACDGPVQMYTLTLLALGSNDDRSTKHYRIKLNMESQYFISEKRKFPSIPELIEYHKLNSGGLVTRLKFPPQDFTAPPTAGLVPGQWEIDDTEIEVTNTLGKGNFGIVKMGIWRGTTKVALKEMKEGTMSEDDFIAEAQVMMELQHPQLVQLFGVCSRSRPIKIVTEYMSHGSLLAYIIRRPNLINKPSCLLDICEQICSAMAYLESMNFIHRDLAARNCLVATGTVIKVADFGLARHVIDDEYTSSQGKKFPIKWAPPEVLHYAMFSSKSDVWSFGVLVWEIFSGGQSPYHGLTNQEVAEKVCDGRVLDQPVKCPNEVYILMRKTWQSEPADRPRFEQLKKMLGSLGSEFRSYTKTNDSY